jgi:hypothetical protein
MKKRFSTLTSSHIVYKELLDDCWSVCTEQEENGNLIMTPFSLLTKEMIDNLPYFYLPIDNPYELKRTTKDEVIEKFTAYQTRMREKNYEYSTL